MQTFAELISLLVRQYSCAAESERNGVGASLILNQARETARSLAIIIHSVPVNMNKHPSQ